MSAKKTRILAVTVLLCLSVAGCNQRDNDLTTSRSIQNKTPTMTSLNELSTRSGLSFNADAKMLSQEDNLGAVQKAQGWVVQVSNVPNAPASATKKTDDEAGEILKVMTNATPGFDFGRLIAKTTESARWQIDKDSWTMSAVKTSMGTFVLVDWIKLN
jgi:hypothetical protein